MTDVHVESAHPTHSDPNNQAMFTRFDCVSCLLSGTKLEIVAKAVKLGKMGNTSKEMKGHSSLHKVSHREHRTKLTETLPLILSPKSINCCVTVMTNRI